MPTEVEFPTEPPESGGQIAVGNGEGKAYFFWSCAWEDVYLTSSDSSEKNEALTQLKRFPETSWSEKHWEDPDGVWSALLERAELGDPSELREFYQSDCAHYREAVQTGP